MCTHTTPDIMFNVFLLPITRTSLYASYFLPSILILWNSLPHEIKGCPSLNILKSRLTSRVDHDNVPKYYYYGPKLTQILHARLRMKSNSLNEHLYVKILLIILIVCVERLNLHIIIYLNVRNIIVNEIVFFEIYFSYWIFDLRKIYYYLAVLTLISFQILLLLRLCINIFPKVNDFHKFQIHHVMLYSECNPKFPFFPYL
jgi:hypothetical protein